MEKQVMSNEDFLSLKKQLSKLEEISNRISSLINNDTFNEIKDLDKIRRKVINDIMKKNVQFLEPEKKSVVKLISKNKEIIDSLNCKKREELSRISNSKKCSQAYYKNY